MKRWLTGASSRPCSASLCTVAEVQMAPSIATPIAPEGLASGMTPPHPGRAPAVARRNSSCPLCVFPTSLAVARCSYGRGLSPNRPHDLLDHLLLHLPIQPDRLFRRWLAPPLLM